MSAPHPPPGGASDAEIAAALAALLAVQAGTDDPERAPVDEAPGSAWRRAAGPVPTAWPEGGWRGSARLRGVR